MADELEKKLNEAEEKVTEIKETPTSPDAPLEVSSQAAVQAEIAHHEDSPVVITLGGRKYTFNTNIYTFVFAILGGLTLLEILIAEVMPIGFFRTFPLAIASLIKALLVMAFYMHLREDNKLFAFAIAVPIVIATIALLFLLAVPSTAYPY